jgi:hypothetical protein
MLKIYSFIILNCFVFFSHAQTPQKCNYTDLSSSSNLVTNGDFESGNTGFSTPLNYYTSSPLNGGQYVITTNAASVHFAYKGTDHTSGTGNFMVINGPSIITNVWCQTVSVQPNTYYRYSAWFNNVVDYANYPNTPNAYVELTINGTTVSKNIRLPDQPDAWVLLDTLWYSGSNTSITLCIKDTSTSGNGNDFSIDDVFFKKCDCAIISAGADTTIMAGDSAQLHASGGTSYSWSPSTALSNSNIANPKASPSSTTQYVVTITNGSCIQRDTLVITVNSSTQTTCNNCDTNLTINNGLVACYPFSNNTNDMTGHGNNGSASSLNYSNDRFNTLNKSGSFNGTSTRVDLPVTSFQLNSYTYSTWVNVSSLPASGNMYSIL